MTLIRFITSLCLESPRGHVEQLPSGSWRARVYAGVDPITQREIRLKATAKTEQQAYIELGRLLKEAAEGHTPESDATMAKLLDQRDHTAAASGAVLAAPLAAERQRLEAANARYEQWSADTRATRDTAGKAAAELQRRRQAQPESEQHPQPEDEPQLTTGWWQQLAADAEAASCADASEHHAARDAKESRAWQRIADMNPSSASRSEPRTSPENEPEQNDRALRLVELLARADRAARRIAAQQAERYASSDYAARMELEAQIRAEARQQAEAQADVELELLRRSASAHPDEPVDQIVHQGYRLRLTAACIGQDAARQVRHHERVRGLLLILAAEHTADPTDSGAVSQRQRYAYVATPGVLTGCVLIMTESKDKLDTTIDRDRLIAELTTKGLRTKNGHSMR